jgi:S1-C subfamily serine protease
MLQKRAVIILTASAISLAVVLGVLLLPHGPGKFESPPDTDSIPSLGITYLPLSPELCACYGLEVDSGVLVTEVVSGSPMDLASVKPGDVILSYNGTRLDEGVPLLCLMRGCPADEEIVLEICRGDCCYSVSCCAGCGTPSCICGHSESAQ